MTGLDWILQNEVLLTMGVSTLSLAAVWLPLTRGAILCWRARQATAKGPSEAVLSVPEVFREVCEESEREGEETPRAFVFDAARQLAVSEYEAHYAGPISMYANLLPPIGFIGTTAGLVILFVSMHLSSDPLRLSALALALSSTIFGLLGYAILEGVKIHLHGRLVRCLDDGIRAYAARA